MRNRRLVFAAARSAAAASAAVMVLRTDIQRTERKRMLRKELASGRATNTNNRCAMREVHSPYGTQTFFTCVAARRNSRPSPSLGSSQSRSCQLAHVRFMFDADASSTVRTPSRPPKYQTASTSSCSARTFDERVLVAGDDVDDAVRHVRRFENTDRSRSRRAGCGCDGIDDRRVARGDRRRRRARSCPSSGHSSGHATPITPIGSFIAIETPRIGTLCTAPSYLSAHAA